MEAPNPQPHAVAQRRGFSGYPTATTWYRPYLLTTYGWVSLVPGWIAMASSGGTGAGSTAEAARVLATSALQAASLAGFTWQVAGQRAPAVHAEMPATVWPLLHSHGFAWHVAGVRVPHCTLKCPMRYSHCCMSVRMWFRTQRWSCNHSTIARGRVRIARTHLASHGSEGVRIARICSTEGVCPLSKGSCSWLHVEEV